MEPMLLDVRSIGGLTDDELFALCAANKMLRIERTKDGEIMLLHPTGTDSGYRNSDINYFLAHWNRQKLLGKVFDSSTGFTLPSGAMRSPDAAFIVVERWEAVPKDERKKFAPICPDFIAELRSENDSIAYLQKKIREEWIANGCRLAWLIDPFEEVVYVYRQDGSTLEIRGFDNTVSGEDVLPDFVLELKGLR